MQASLRPKVLLVVLVSAFLAGPSDAHAFLAFESDPPVPRPAYAMGQQGNQRPCITCHNNPDGGSACANPPCLNPFGMSVQPAVHSGDLEGIWTPAVAAADADGDGFTNGQELQDPTGNWAVFTARPGVAAYATRPGHSEDHPGLHDADGDRYCWFGRDLDMNGTCTGSEASMGFDCNDSAGTVNSGATEICTDFLDNDCNGLTTVQDPVCSAVVDADDDGFCPMGVDSNNDGNCAGAGEGRGTVQDCDDGANTRYPNAPENCTDGQDGNCNGIPDASDSACTGDHDNDNDGYCPVGQDLNDDGDCLDAGEATNVSDCNDNNVNVNPGATEVCGDAADNNCNGNADFMDPVCFSVADMDGDGVCPNGLDMDGDGSCIDAGEEGAGFDCEDDDPDISSAAIEICTDAIDQDCDSDPGIFDNDCTRFLDLDNDHYCPIGQDLPPFNQNCADPGEIIENGDCDDADDLINPARTEELALCLNGADDNCNGVVDAREFDCIAYLDQDFDGFCTIGRDMNDDGDCDDADEQTADTDAAASDPTVFPGAPENCFDHKDNDQDGTADFLGEGVFPMDPKCRQDVDVDGDGACPVGRDVNGDGDCLDTGENYRESDCDDSDPTISPKAVEDYVSGLPRSMQPCFDYIDNDCDANVDLQDASCFYVFDDDEDGFCRHGIDDNADGDCLDASEDRGGFDCDDSNDAIRPGATEICDDAIDNDCDTFIDREDASCGCTADTDCAAMECKTATCNAGVCTYTDMRSCGGGKCTTSVPASGGATLPLVGLLGAAALAVFARRRVRRGSFSTNRSRALDVSDSRRMS